MTDSGDIDPLCCCEYFDQNNERYHILGCCCNCDDFDKVCERPISEKHKTGMLLTFQDRFRVPWRDGAKQVSLDAIAPIFIIPVIFGIAAINFYCLIIILVASFSFIGYLYYFLRRGPPRTRFFFMWILWSTIYLLLIFETTVPLLEILPGENYALITLVCLSQYFLFKTRQEAHKNTVHNKPDDEIPHSDDESASIFIDHDESTSIFIDHDEEDVGRHQNVCSVCKKQIPPRSSHCLLCQVCIYRRDYHSLWLDCCIGEFNHRVYILGLLFSHLALMFGADLTLTSVCHPYLAFKIFSIPFLFPDDCSEVFDQYETSLSFIISVYSVIIAFFLTLFLILQLFIISKGLTLTEWEKGQEGNRKSMFANWRKFSTH